MKPLSPATVDVVLLGMRMYEITCLTARRRLDYVGRYVSWLEEETRKADAELASIATAIAEVEAMRGGE